MNLTRPSTKFKYFKAVLEGFPGAFRREGKIRQDTKSDQTGSDILPDRKRKINISVFGPVTMIDCLAGKSNRTIMHLDFYAFGTRIRKAFGTTSKTAGSFPGSSPSVSM